MSSNVVRLAVAAAMLVPAVAYAQSKSVVLDGQRADVVVTPMGDVSKAAVGLTKDDYLDLASKASPSVIILPSKLPGASKAVR